MTTPIEVKMYDELPRYKVKAVSGDKCVVDGGDHDDVFLSTRSISTYPYLPSGEKDGDPIADRLFAQIHNNRALVAVADGCNWGKRPQMAARDAVAAAAEYLSDKSDHIKDVQDAGHYLLRSFSQAHNKIVSGKEDIWEAGTTTLLNSLCLQLDPENDKEPAWGFLCASVGDCKAFLIEQDTKRIIDVTMGNRNNVTDGKDPGGRLGPYVDNGKPDLRNLRLYFCPCKESDVVLIVSDGVHDNLDPQTIGKLPKDLGLSQTGWDEFTHDELLKIKSGYMKKLLNDLIMDDLNPMTVTKKVIAHCLEITRRSREFMESNPNKKQPNDYIEYPGKMDHTTCVTFIVGHPINGTNDNSASASTSTSASNTNNNSASASTSDTNNESNSTNNDNNDATNKDGDNNSDNDANKTETAPTTEEPSEPSEPISTQ